MLAVITHRASQLIRPATSYIADAMNNRIRRRAVSTGDISTIASNEYEGYSGDGGPADQRGDEYPL